MSNDVRIDLVINGNDFNVQLKRADRTLRQLGVTATRSDKAFRRTDSSITRMVKGLRDFTLIGASVRGTLMTLRDITFGWQGQIIRANAEIEKLTVLLAGMSGESTYAAAMEEGTKQTRELINLATRLPFTISTIADSTAKLKAVGLDPLGGSVTALSDAVAQFGGDDQIFHRATIAIQQMSGKGVISMEELRQQLGEAIPNVMQVMTDATGMAMDDMVRAISQGRVRSEGTIQKMLDQFEMRFGGASGRLMDTWDGMLSRMRTQTDVVFKQIGDAGYFDALKTQVRDFTTYLASPEMKELATTFGVKLASAIEGMRDALDSTVSFVRENKEEFIALGTAVKHLLAFWVASKFTRPIVKMGEAAANALPKIGALIAGMKTAGTRAGMLGVPVKTATSTTKAFTLAAKGLLRFLGPIGLALTAAEVGMWAWRKATKDTTPEIEKNADAMGRLAENSALYYDEATRGAALKSMEAERVQMEAAGKAMSDLAVQQSKVASKVANYQGDDAGLSALQAELESIRLGLVQTGQIYQDAARRVKEGQAIMSEAKAQQTEELMSFGLTRLEQSLSGQMSKVNGAYAKALDEAKLIRDKASLVIGDYKAQLVEQANKMTLEAVAAHGETSVRIYEAAAEKQRAVADRSAKELADALASGDEARIETAQENANREIFVYSAYMDRVAEVREAGAARLKRAGTDIELMASGSLKPGERLEKLMGKIQTRMVALNETTATPGSSKWANKQLAEIRQIRDELLATNKAGKDAEESIRRETARAEAAVSAYAQAYSTDRYAKGLEALQEQQAKLNAEIEGGSGAAAKMQEAVANGDFGEEMARQATLAVEDQSEAYKVLKATIDGVASSREQLSLIEGYRSELRSLAGSFQTETDNINQAIRESSLSMKEAFDQETQAMVARFEELIVYTKEGSEERKKIEADYYEWKEARERQSQRLILGGLQEQLEQQANVTAELSSRGAQGVGELADAMSDYMIDGKNSFSEMAESLLRDLAKIIVRATITKMILEAIGLVTNTTSVPTSQSGMPVGADRATVPPPQQPMPTFAAWGGINSLKTLSGLDRHRGGVLSSPTIMAAEAGMNEAFVPLPDGRSIPVTVKGSMGAAPNIDINVINQSGQEMDAEQGEMRFDGKRMILDVVLSAASKPGRFRDGMRSAIR